MKKTASTQMTKSVFAFALLWLVSFSQDTREVTRLVAPAYPGSKKLNPALIESKVANREVFGAKASHGTVEAFYFPKYAKKDVHNEGRLKGDYDHTLIVHSYGQVLEILQDHHLDLLLARASEILIQWQAETNGLTNSVNHIFRGLEIQSQMFAGHESELDELERKYAYLKVSYYLDGKDVEIVNRCEKDLGVGGIVNPDAATLNEYNDKLNKLVKEGRQKEIAKLNEETFGASDRKRKVDHFNEWKKCLLELDSVSYLTKISIDLDPVLWR